MPKIKFIQYALYAILYWLLVNLCWCAFILKFEPSWNLLDILEAFIGVHQLYYAFQNIFFAIYFICITLLFLYWWVKKPSLFKAIFLIALSPYVGLFAFSCLPVFIYAPIWLIGFTIAAYAVRWANTGKWTPIMEK